MSSEEDKTTTTPAPEIKTPLYRYYPPVDENDLSKYKYMIVVEGSLAYIGDNSFSIYLTTGRAYDIDSWVISLPTLQTHITPGYAAEFMEDRDYIIMENILEFNRNIFETGEANIIDTILYCPKVSIIEEYIYDMYGKMIGIPNWSDYNHDNYSGKTAINSILKGLQDGSNIADYNRALNAYYGIPIAPKDSQVIGLYESYPYLITAINDNQITVQLPNGIDLHPFIQSGTRFLVEGKKEVKIDYVVDRSAGTIMLIDASYLVKGDTLNIKLKNRFVIKDIIAETEDENPYITVYTQEGPYAIKHLIDIVQALSNNTKYPEIIIYNMEKFPIDYNGIYHIVDVEPLIDVNGLIKLKLYKKPNNAEPIYNDYISQDMTSTSSDIVHGYVHIPWPTHKFLYLYMDNKSYYKSYFDAPIDTIYEENDSIIKYQILARNVSLSTKNMFPDWNQFDCFKKYNGLNFESDILEITRIMPGGTFGSYFPSKVV